MAHNWQMNDNFCQLWPITDITVVLHNSWPFFFPHNRLLSIWKYSRFGQHFCSWPLYPSNPFLLYRCLLYIDLVQLIGGDCRDIKDTRLIKATRQTFNFHKSHMLSDETSSPLNLLKYFKLRQAWRSLQLSATPSL